ncbi:hypothetical protein F5Y06DRAFT_274959 [Hypoxylon sp. FL0890]|nr:hypothetical protein F5Y06DRAFT_274959 [Hypoxylon sp. FL0890]
MSDESDIEGRVASEQDDYPDEYDPEEYESEEANEFLDMEVAESDDQSEHGDNSSLDDTEPAFFPQFTRLPPELRARIWEYFDPDLKTKPRVFELILSLTLGESACLADQTAPARAMLATHHESRALALKSYPDTLDLYGGSGILRYNSAKDLIYVLNDFRIFPKDMEAITSQMKNPSHVAVLYPAEEAPHFDMPPHAKGKLRSLYFASDTSHDFKRKGLQWCVSDSVHSYYRQWIEEEAGIPHVVETRYCWPDIDNHRGFAKENVRQELFPIEGVEIWPMFEFFGRDGLDLYHKIQDAVSTESERGDQWSSDTESEDESSTEDEYESEGIDDATIDGDESLSEDEDDLVVQPDSEEDDASNFNGFSPLRDENQELSLGEEVGVGNFSSLEPESPIHVGSESEHPASDAEPVVKASRRKRRIVSSDDEHESEDERNETAQMSSRPAKRSRVVLSDTEDEEDEVNKNNDEGVEHGREATDESEDNENSEEEESDESEEEEEEEEPVKAKPMSLFEKLRQFRDEVPVSPDSGPGSDGGDSMDNEDFGEGGNINFTDDEVDDEDGLLENDAISREMSESGEEDEW